MCRLHRQEVRIGVIALLGAMTMQAGVSHADHDHGFAMSGSHAEASSEVSAGVAIEAAEYDSGFYVGSYQGIAPSLGWQRGRFGASAMIGLYHIEENGLSVYGVGDAM